MICPKCGSMIQNGSAFCPYCGTTFTVGQQYVQQQYVQPQQQFVQPQQQFAQPQQQFAQPQQQFVQPQQQFVRPQQAAVREKSGNAGLIVGICIGAAGLITGIVILLMFFLGNKGADASVTSVTEKQPSSEPPTTSASDNINVTSTSSGRSGYISDMQYSTKVYDDENVTEFSGSYTGDLKNDVPDGYGTLYVSMDLEGSEYTGTIEGNWKNGLPDGDSCVVDLTGKDPDYPDVIIKYQVNGKFENGRIINGSSELEYLFTKGSTVVKKEFANGKTIRKETLNLDENGNIINE